MHWHKPGTLLQFLLFVYRSFMQNKGLENAKSLTYTSLFAVVPLVTLVFAILSAFPSFQVFGAQVQDMIFDRLLPSSSRELDTYLADFAAQAKNLTWVGALMLFVTAYLMLVNIERNFNLIWGVGELRKGLSSFLLYWSVLSLGPLLFGIGFGISSYVTSLSLFERFTEVSELIGAKRALLGMFPILLSIGAFTLLYVAVPNCGVKIKHGLSGALVVALSFILVKLVFSRFIATASYALIYGTFAAIPIFLMWLYICWVVILMGANLVRCIPLFSTDNTRDDIHPTLVLLALIHLLWEKHQAGEVLKVQQLMDERWPLKQASAETLLGLLLEKNIIVALNQGEFMLVRDLGNVSLWYLLGTTPWAQPTSKDVQQDLPDVLIRHLPDQVKLAGSFRKLELATYAEFSTNFGEWFRDPAWWPQLKPQAPAAASQGTGEVTSTL